MRLESVELRGVGGERAGEALVDERSELLDIRVLKHRCEKFGTRDGASTLA